MKYILSKKKTSIISALSLAAIPNLAFAAEPEKSPEENVERIEVVGKAEERAQSPKMTAPLLDTPRTITVINENLIKDTGATSLQDVLRTVPGITLGSGEGGTPVGDRPMIRGYESSTDIMIDGMRDYARGSHETFNLESVEVSKGPASAYSGRGSTGGSINLVTKKPLTTNFTAISAGYGTEEVGKSGRYRVTIDTNYVFTDSIAARLNVMKDEGKIAGRGGVESDRIGIAPTVTFGVDTDTRFNLSYTYLKNDDTPDLGLPFKNEANPDRVTPIESGRDHTFYGRKAVDFREYESKTATASLEHDITDLISGRTVLRKIDTKNQYLFTRPNFDNCTATSVGACQTEGEGLQYSRTNRSLYRESESLISQTDIFGQFTTGSLNHSFSTGIEYSKEEIFNRALTITGAPNEVVDFYNPPNFSYPDFNMTVGNRTDAGYIETTAAYIADTIEITPKWNANLGLRYDDYKVDNTRDSRTDEMWNYQVGVVYKPVANGSIYVNYATSSNPSGENLGQNGGADGAAGAAQIRDLPPEKSKSIELGSKWELFNSNLTLTGAIFQTEKTDARTADPITGEVTLDGNNRVRGFEASAAGRVNDDWTIWASYVFLDPEVISYASSRTSGDFAGNQMKFTAKNSYTLWTTYNIMPKLEVGGGLVYVGKRFVDDANIYYLPSHTRFDAMFKYEVTDALRLQLNLNNITDEKVYDASHVGIFSLIAPGRSATLTASYRFE